MTEFSELIKEALEDYDKKNVSKSSSKESTEAIKYLRLLIKNNEADVTLYNTIYYLLHKGVAPNINPKIKSGPLKKNGLLFKLLSGVIEVPKYHQKSKKHLLILLDGWDWIQLSNVHKYVEKHGTKEVDVTTLKNLPKALANLVDGTKIHVIGHGGVNSFAKNTHTTPIKLAEVIHDKVKLDVKFELKVETCSSALPDKSGDTTAKTIKKYLISQKRKVGDIRVSGTTGPSVTGVKDKRIVVNPKKESSANKIQEKWEDFYKNDIYKAKIKCLGLDSDSDSDKIKKVAIEVWKLTEPFFIKFKNDLEHDTDMVISHKDKLHKEIY